MDAAQLRLDHRRTLLITLTGHWIFGWFAYVNEQQAHTQPIELYAYAIAGQKIVFWGVTLGGLLLLASGLTLMFPFYWFGYDGMQTA